MFSLLEAEELGEDSRGEVADEGRARRAPRLPCRLRFWRTLRGGC